MGFRGAMRSLNALARAQAREQRRELRELKRALKDAEKEDRLREAATEVAVFDATIGALNSVHKECGPVMSWRDILAWPPPEDPLRPDTVTNARRALDNYQPGFWARLFGGAKRKRAELEAKIDEASDADSRKYEELLREHREVRQQLERLQVLARAIVERDVDAYVRAFDELDSFDELQELGIELRPRALPERRDALAVDVTVEEKQVVPASTKTLTKTGKVSSRPMAKSRAAEIYQDYVCGAALRISREVFAALPVEFVLVTCSTSLLDESTGASRPTPILSVIASRSVVGPFNFEALDPSSAMTNLQTRMAFKRGEGMRAIEPFTPAEIPGG